MLTVVKSGMFHDRNLPKNIVFLFLRQAPIPVSSISTGKLKFQCARKEAEFAPGARYREWPSKGPTSKLASPAAALALAGAFDPACVQHRKHTHRIYLWCVYTQTLTHTHSNVPGRVHSIIIITHRARRSRFTVREIVICCRLHWSPTARRHPTLISPAEIRRHL